VETIICYIALCILVPFYARKKGYPPLEYFILSLIMTPIVGIIIVFFLKKRNLEDNPAKEGGGEAKPSENKDSQQ
jgi:Mn2+/Fe2+ NRAMP family transporter